MWCSDAPARNSWKKLDMSLPSRSEWISRTRGRGRALPSASSGVPTVASNAATMRWIAAAASDLSLMTS